MNAIETPIPLEQEYPELAEHIRKISHKEHPVVKTLIVERNKFRFCCRFGNDPLVWKERRFELPGRNDPCSCGSGKKYKKCCLH